MEIINMEGEEKTKVYKIRKHTFMGTWGSLDLPRHPAKVEIVGSNPTVPA